MPKQAFVEVPDEAWNVAQVELYTGLDRVTIWRKVKKGVFPAHHHVLSTKRWWKSEIIRWVAGQQVDRAPRQMPTPSRRRGSKVGGEG